MRVNDQPTHDTSPAGVRQATGKEPREWFDLIDARLGSGAGRKALGDFLFKEMKLDPWGTATLTVEYEAARGLKEKDGHLRGYSICVTKSIAAPVQQVFDAWAGGSWMGAAAQQKFEEGGGFDDGDGHSGTFRKIVPDKLIRFTLEDKGQAPASAVEIKFTTSGGKCSIVLTHDRIASRGAADGLRAAWSEAFTALKGSLE